MRVCVSLYNEQRKNDINMHTVSDWNICTTTSQPLQNTTTTTTTTTVIIIIIIIIIIISVNMTTSIKPVDINVETKQ